MDEWYKLKKVGLQDSLIYKLMLEFEKFEDIFKALENEQIRMQFSKEIVYTIEKSLKIDLTQEFELLERRKIKFLSYKSDKYPKILKNISNPPLFLYIKGAVEFPERSIGVIGTRRMTAYGRSAAEKLVKELVERDICIVSGLAEGIDTVAHTKALLNKGKTIAVVGSGLDIIFPKRNKDLWERISEHGTIISEYPPGTEPFKWNFPQRNRIIAGISKGVLIVESYKDGGALITAKIALDENREVFAIPGLINLPSFEGCNELIKKGEAKLTSSFKDIFEEFGWSDTKIEYEKIDEKLTEEEKMVYMSLIHEKTLDDIILDTKYPTNKLLSIVMGMEIKGLIKSIPGGRYIRNQI